MYMQKDMWTLMFVSMEYIFIEAKIRYTTHDPNRVKSMDIFTMYLEYTKIII